jgi:hypothetical protein
MKHSGLDCCMRRHASYGRPPATPGSAHNIPFGRLPPASATCGVFVDTAWSTVDRRMRRRSSTYLRSPPVLSAQVSVTSGTCLSSEAGSRVVKRSMAGWCVNSLRRGVFSGEPVDALPMAGLRFGSLQGHICPGDAREKVLPKSSSQDHLGHLLIGAKPWSWEGRTPGSSTSCGARATSRQGFVGRVPARKP